MNATMDKPAKTYGPFRLTGGLLQQDEPIGKNVKVAKLDNGFLVCADGEQLKLADGAHVTDGQRRMSCWRAGIRTAPTDLRPNDDVQLREQKTYGPPSTPETHRREGVLYQPFTSDRQLTRDPNINKPGAIKVIEDREEAQADEIAELRRQNEELRQRLANGDAERAEDAGRKMAENADKRQPTQPGQKKIVP